MDEEQIMNTQTTVAGYWKEFHSAVFPEADAEQLINAMRVFYAGAQAMFSLAIDPRVEFGDVYAELGDFLESQKIISRK